MLQIMQDCIVSDHVLEFRRQSVTVCEPGFARRIRNEAAAAAYVFRRRCHASMTKRQIDETVGWQVHHITPVRFGGSNDQENFALTHPVLHAMIHRIIARQTDGMEIGETRNIRMPYMRGFIWAL